MQEDDSAEFRATLRMDVHIYQHLYDLLKSSLQKKYTNFREPIPPSTRLAITMRFLALGDGYLSLSQQFRVGLSTCRLIVLETCCAIIKCLGNQYLVTPSTKQDWLQVASDYNRLWNMPHVVGTLDGKHIRMAKPRKSGSFFFNYKDFFSIVLLGIASADYRFLYIDVGAEGKASDGGIWAKSSFHDHLNHPDNPLQIPGPEHFNGIDGRLPFFLVGDDAFPLGPNLVKPFPGHGLTRKQRIFNYRLSRCRRVIENTFGILTCRFRVFRRTIEVNPNYLEKIVFAPCILHNFLRDNASSDYIPLGAVDMELEAGSLVPGAWRQELNLDSLQRNSQRNASQYAKEMRNKLADYFLTAEGELPWQYKYV